VPAIAIFFLLMAPSLSMTWTYFDENMYGIIGREILRGHQLYTQLWDHHQPGQYFLFAGITQLFGADLLPFHLINMALLSVACIYIVLIIRLFQPHIAPRLYQTILILLAFFMGSGVSETYILNTETVMIAGSSIAVYYGYCYLYGTNKKNKKWAGIIALLALTIISFFKIHSWLESIFLLCFVGYASVIIGASSIRQAINHTLLRISVLCIPYIVYFALRYQDAKEIFYTMFVTNATYIQTSSVFDNPFLKVMLCVGVLVLLYRIYRKKTIGLPELFAYSWLVVVLFITLMTNKLYFHYLLQVSAPLFLVMSLVCAKIPAFSQSHVSKKQAMQLFSTAFGTLLVPLFLFAIPTLIQGTSHQYVNPRIVHMFTNYIANYYGGWYTKVATGKQSVIDWSRDFDVENADSLVVGDKIAAAAQSAHIRYPTLFNTHTYIGMYISSDAAPATKYISSHHIPPKAYEQITLQLLDKKPDFITTHRIDTGAQSIFTTPVQSQYTLIDTVGNFKIYERNDLTTRTTGERIKEFTFYASPDLPNNIIH
jgi:hypothetical protein